MKGMVKLFGIIALVAVVGFMMTACPDGSGGGGGGGPIALTENIWKDGEITAGKSSIEYSFTVKSGSFYYVWWNDSGQGDVTKTLDIVVSVTYSDGEALTPAINAVDNGWNTPQPLISLKNGTVIVKVTPKNSGGTGTFAVMYTTSSTRPPIFPSTGIIPLTVNEWKDGEIDTAGKEIWYSISAANGTAYNFWWNEKTPDGDGTKTLDIRVSAWYYSSGSSVANFSTVDSAWTTPQSFTATSGGLVYIRVTPKTAGETGTYAIGYSTTTTKPGSEQFVIPGNATPLTEAQWENGNITSTDKVDWYSISSVTSGTYRLWWNETGGSSNGDSSKTGNVSVSAWYANGTPIFEDADSAWSTARQIIVSSANAGSTIYIKVTASVVGTYGIAYSTLSSRPLVLPATIIELTADQWEDGELSSDTSVDWYKITVTSGTTYRFWWNERGAYGNGTKTADLYVSVYYPNGTSAFSNADYAWDTARQFTPSSDGTVYVEVKPYPYYSNNNFGTYGIVYSTGSTRPAAPIIVTPVPLVENVWTNAEITTVGDMHWYSITVTTGTTYRFWGNQRTSGNDTKTIDIRISAYYTDGTSLFVDRSPSWNTSSPPLFEATSDGTVYVKVVAYTSSSYNPVTTGTYGIVYSTAGNTMPPSAINVSNTPLTELKWEDGEIDTTYPPNWYSFSVTNGTQYYLWWNETGSSNGNGTKTGNIRVSAYYSDGTMIFNNVDNGWSSYPVQSINANKDDTVYLKVSLYSTNNAGTYGIVYSTNNSRPLILPAVITPLTANTWADGEITSVGETKWYSFSVTSGSEYRVWRNDDSYRAGNGTKTHKEISVYAWYHNGTSVISSPISTGWTTPYSFNANLNSTVYIQVSSRSTNDTGTYGIVYSTGTTRPDANIIVSATPLVAGTWTNGDISVGTLDWYSIQVVNGTKYNFWWNERGGESAGDGTKTGDITVQAYYSTGEQVIYSNQSGSAWRFVEDYVANKGGTLYIRVSTGAGGAGTYGIVYTTGGDFPERPAVP